MLPILRPILRLKQLLLPTTQVQARSRIYALEIHICGAVVALGAGDRRMPLFPLLDSMEIHALHILGAGRPQVQADLSGGPPVYPFVIS